MWVEGVSVTTGDGVGVGWAEGWMEGEVEEKKNGKGRELGAEQ